MKNKIILTLTFLFLINFSFSQIKKKDLKGVWKTKKDLFYKADTIKFYKKINSCHQIVWIIEKRKFKSFESSLCSEPTKNSVSVGIEKIKLKKKDYGQIIELYQNSILTDKFRIVELNKTSLKLMRFDKLSEQKLYKYVDSLIFKVLKYKPKLDTLSKNDSIKKITVPNKRHKTDDYIMRCPSTIIGNPEPLIIINGYSIKNKNILKELLLVETYFIKNFTKIEAVALGGSKAINGLIIIKTSENRFKKLLKKYAR